MSGGAVAAGILQGVGGIMGGASGPISSAINAHVYKKYGLHEPEYVAASQRAAGINPLLASGGNVADPPNIDLGDMGESLKGGAAGIVNAMQIKNLVQENKNLTSQESLIDANTRKTVLEASAIDPQDIKKNPFALNNYQRKMADLKLTNASEAKMRAEADLANYRKEEGKADAEFWSRINQDPDFATGVKTLQTLINSVKGLRLK